MNILVMGGSYFLGRYFVNMACANNSVYVFNRGNCPLNMPGVTEIRGDRNLESDLASLAEYEFDVVVDFCAYNKGDIMSVSKILKIKTKQYIFISTVDVYRRGLGTSLAEDAPLEMRNFGGPEGEYIAGKVALEQEIKEAADIYGFSYTVIRPAFIYGPGNYAPREGLYFNWISQAGQILHPADATGEFQLVYVIDVAKAIVATLGNEDSFNEAYNVTGEKIEDYNSFADTLVSVVGTPFERVDISVDVVNEKGIPLPFPLTKDESNWYCGEKVLSLIGQYTSFEDGMKVTAREAGI